MRVHPGQGTKARVPSRPASPGTRQQQFSKPFSEARTGQVSRATGRGRSFSKGPASLSLQPMRNRRFPVHCCLLLTPQRSASGLAVYEQEALPMPPPAPIHLSAPFTKSQSLWVTWLGVWREKKKNDTTKTQVPKTSEVYIRRYLPYAPLVTNDSRAFYLRAEVERESGTKSRLKERSQRMIIPGCPASEKILPKNRDLRVGGELRKD